MFSKRVRADLALGFCALIWGATFVAVKDALADVSVIVYIAIRFALAAVVMAIFFRRSLRGITRKAVWAGAQIGFCMFTAYVFQTAGLKYTTPSKAAFITGSSVVIVPLLLALFARRKINLWIWAGALSALVGLVFPHRAARRTGRTESRRSGSVRLRRDVRRPHDFHQPLHRASFRRRTGRGAGGYHRDSRNRCASALGHHRLGAAAPRLDRQL